VPFAIDIDGPYYSVLNFFQRVAELERIVNIGNLQMTNTKTTSAAKVKGTYQYEAGASWLPVARPQLFSVMNRSRRLQQDRLSQEKHLGRRSKRYCLKVWTKGN